MKIQNKLGLTFDFLPNGLVKSIHTPMVRIDLGRVSAFSAFGTNIYLRKRGNPIEYIALLGPKSPSSFIITPQAYIAKGSWSDIEYECTLQLSSSSYSWEWSVDILSKNECKEEYDLIYVQDVGLKLKSEELLNEHYVSQYIERILLEESGFGKVACCRQNLSEGGKNPWLMLVCLQGAQSACTDGAQFYGSSFRENDTAQGLLLNRLGGEYAGESSMIAIQRKPFTILKGKVHKTSFVGHFLAHHPDATSAADIKRLASVQYEFAQSKFSLPQSGWKKPKQNLFTESTLLNAHHLSEKEVTHFFGTHRQHEEVKDGRVLSFFTPDFNHIVLKEKELLVDRPHGHIVQGNVGLIPTEGVMSSNTFAYGVFNSHISQGNTNFNIFLSICSNPFNLNKETGQRIFVKVGGQFYLLGVPSAYEMGLNYSRWIYKHSTGVFEVRVWTSKISPLVNMDFRVLEGDKIDIVVSNHLDKSNGWVLRNHTIPGQYVAKPNSSSMLGQKFPEAQFRMIIQGSGENVRLEIIEEDEYLVLFHVPQTKHFGLSIVGEIIEGGSYYLIDDFDNQFKQDIQEAIDDYRELSLNLDLEGNPDVDVISQIIPWFTGNALVHYLTPYGLEQFSGAAWGTRDVAQGPIDLLLHFERYQEAKEVLKLIFSHQNTDGGWRQWWMFDSYRHVRSPDAHGDIIYWCVLALCKYIGITSDYSILDEMLPYYSEETKGASEVTPLREHMGRLMDMVVNSFIPQTALVPYGGGDWNDSLQPVNQDLARRMISSWTVQMCYQTFVEYAKVCKRSGDLGKAQWLQNLSQRVSNDFNKYLVRDGVVAGYGLVEQDGTISLMLHPSDKTSGVKYSLLPMERGVLSGLFTKEQAEHHLALIEQHLLGPDGARLMNRPLKYKGGIQHIFQRAESSTFFGREIGLMYTHEHMRYAELLSILGKPQAFIKALRQIVPIAYQQVVPNSDWRQTNCYYSSSDVVFETRYQADEKYEKVIEGEVLVKGGWRVYSSGSGIFMGIIVSRLLGLRIDDGNVILDPVMPKTFDGLNMRLDFRGRAIQWTFHVKKQGFSPYKILLNGKPMDLSYQQNRYRKGGAIVGLSKFMALLTEDENSIDIFI